MSSSPFLFAARQRHVGPEHRYDAPKGPACVTVYDLVPVVSARPRSSHDPPIAALRGSCARLSGKAQVFEAEGRDGVERIFALAPLYEQQVYIVLGGVAGHLLGDPDLHLIDRKSTRLNSSH